MSAEEDAQTCVPSLSWFCQRVAGKHVDAISDFGPQLSLRYDLLQPILERCSVPNLLRLEGTAPHIASSTQDLWKVLCSKNYSIEQEKFLSSGEPSPMSWRDHYFMLQEWNKQRFEAIGSKMRNQREAFESQKRESAVKFTDRVPPREKKSQWNTVGWRSSAPRTLMQKARVDTAKLSRFEAPLTNVKKDYRTNPPARPLLPVPPPSYAHRVSVNTVKAPRCPGPAYSSSTASSPSYSPPPPPYSSLLSPTSKHHSNALPAFLPAKRNLDDTASPPNVSIQTQDQTAPRPVKRQKKDPMAALFVPKVRAHSQRPTMAR